VRDRDMDADDIDDEAGSVVTTRISLGPSAAQANDGSFNPAISANGMYVAFQSSATNLVSGTDTNGTTSDIYVRAIGGTITTRISLHTSGTQGNAASYAPRISDNGRYITYISSASNLVDTDTNGTPDIFVRDRDTDANGVYDEVGKVSTTRVSVDSSNVQSNGESSYPSISSNGRYIVFESSANNLVGTDTNGKPDIFLRDRDTDADGTYDEAGQVATIRISVDSGNNEADSDSFAATSISTDGRFVAFSSDSSNLVIGDTNSRADIFVRDRDADADGTYDEVGLVSTTRVSVDTSLTESDNNSYNPSIALVGSGATEGYYVAYNSDATNLVSDDTNDASDVFFHDHEFNADNTPPNVTIEQALGQLDPITQTSASPINFTAVFDETIKPATFIGADLTLGGTGTLSAVVSQTNSTTFNIAVSGMSGNSTVTAALNAGKVTDLAGNPNTASASTDNSVDYVDQTPPSVAISSTSVSPINGAITVKVTFSENVTGFVVGDITVTNAATPSNFLGSGAVYTFTLTPTTDGVVTADINASVATDPAGNLNTAAPQFTRTYDGTRPDTFIDAPLPPNPDTDNMPTFTFHGTDASPGVVASFQCKMDSGTYAACVSPFTSTALSSASHTFYVYAVDNASNMDTITPASYAWTVDTIAPTVISSTLANPNPTSRLSASFTVTFSEAVTGVDAADFSLITTGVTGASITGVSGSGATWTVTVSTGSGNGTIHLNVLANGTILDVVNHPLNGAFSSGLTYTVTKVLTFYSSSTQDGWILETSENSKIGGAMNTGATTLRVGDDSLRKQYRTILSFSTGASLPDDAFITLVTFKIKRSSVVGGGNPVTIFGGFFADVKKGFFGTKSTLQTSDFQATSTVATFKSYGPFKPTPVGGWYTINLTSAKSYMNKVTTSSGLTQIRLRFKLDDNNNGSANYLNLFSGNTATVANRPQLIITFNTP
jgi:hypothetical protein